MVFKSSFVLTLKPLSFCEMNQSVILLFCMNLTYNYTPAPKGGDIIFDHYVSVCLLVTNFCHILSEKLQMLEILTLFIKHAKWWDSFLNKFNINLQLYADCTYYVYSLCIMGNVREETEDVVQSKFIIP